MEYVKSGESAVAPDETSLPVPSSWRVILQDGWAGDYARSRPGDGNGLGRRVLSAGLAAASLALAAPVLVLAAVAIKLTSSGPVIYSQARVGLERRRGKSGEPPYADRDNPDRRKQDAGGRVFRMYKFRTMQVNGDHHEARQAWATRDDPRITPVGQVLRAFRIDELPQMVNVLLGDMRIVGPRPEQPRIFRELRQELADYPRRQHVPPGITGWAQVNNGYDRNLEDVQNKLKLDLEYLERRSLAMDLKIGLRTIPVVLFRRGSL